MDRDGWLDTARAALAIGLLMAAPYIVTALGW